MPNVSQQIAQGAKARDLDPAAVLAVASREGLSGKIGDGGTSFGPFQLHIGGALPAAIGALGPVKAQAWAMSPVGLNYALDHIATVAKGLKGSQAVVAIVSRFERPRDVPDEIAGADSALGDPVPASPAGTPSITPTVSAATSETMGALPAVVPQRIAALAPLSMPGFAAVKSKAPTPASPVLTPTMDVAPKVAADQFLAGLPKPGRAPKAPGGVKPKADSLKLKLPKQSVRKGRSGITPTRKQKAIEPL